MKCSQCNGTNDKVIDSRSFKDGTAIRRRRECTTCGHRFTTYEYIESFQPVVIKKDLRRDTYNRDKLIAGIIISCKKRPVSMDTICTIADAVERHIEKENLREIESITLGQIVMKELYSIDKIAYIRFASVYRDFSTADEFIEQVGELD